MSTRYVTASERATIICQGIAKWAEFQNTKPRDPAHNAAFDEWFNFCQAHRLTDEVVEYIKATQYGVMTWAINH